MSYWLPIVPVALVSSIGTNYPCLNGINVYNFLTPTYGLPMPTGYGFSDSTSVVSGFIQNAGSVGLTGYSNITTGVFDNEVLSFLLVLSTVIK